MTRPIADDPRIDPRIKAMFGGWIATRPPDIESRESLMAMIQALGERPPPSSMLPEGHGAEYERLAPSAGLSFRRETVCSEPDGNRIVVHMIAPEGAGPLPCVVYIHGGGMMALSAFDENYQAWGRMIARQGVAVAMVEFRNALRPSSLPEIAPYPAGLNDCVSAFRWVRRNAGRLGVDPARLVVAGESGGANLSIATALRLKQAGELGAVKGLYVLCPFIAGSWSVTEGTSVAHNDGIVMRLDSNYSVVAYGQAAYEARDPAAWPGFATEADVAGFPPVVVAVNECDILLDEGVAFYRLLLRAGVPARCRQVMGTIHGTEVYVLPCPDISLEAARDIAAFCRGEP